MSSDRKETVSCQPIPVMFCSNFWNIISGISGTDIQVSNQGFEIRCRDQAIANKVVALCSEYGEIGQQVTLVVASTGTSWVIAHSKKKERKR